MTPIAPGDIVECIGPFSPTSPGQKNCGYKLHALYTVSETGVMNGVAWLNCVGMPTPPDVGIIFGIGWDARSFRPISRKTNFAKFLAEVSEPCLKPAEKLATVREAY